MVNSFKFLYTILMELIHLINLLVIKIIWHNFEYIIYGEILILIYKIGAFY